MREQHLRARVRVRGVAIQVRRREGAGEPDRARDRRGRRIDELDALRFILVAQRRPISRRSRAGDRRRLEVDRSRCVRPGDRRHQQRNHSDRDRAKPHGPKRRQEPGRQQPQKSDRAHEKPTICPWLRRQANNLCWEGAGRKKPSRTDRNCTAKHAAYGLAQRGLSATANEPRSCAIGHHRRASRSRLGRGMQKASPWTCPGFCPSRTDGATRVTAVTRTCGTRKASRVCRCCRAAHATRGPASASYRNVPIRANPFRWLRDQRKGLAHRDSMTARGGEGSAGGDRQRLVQS